MADGVLFELETLRAVVRDLRRRADAGNALAPPAGPDAGRTTGETAEAIQLLDAGNVALASDLEAIAAAIDDAVADLLATDQGAATGFSGMEPR